MTFIILSIIGVFVVVIIALLQRKRKNAAILVTLILIVGLGLYIYFSIPKVTEKGDIGEIISWSDVVMYLMMLAGMLAKYFWDVIEQKKRFKIDGLQLIKPMLVSPIIFIGIVTLTVDTNLSLLHFLLSFQNGFFWQTILYKQKGNI
jgi:hypothetical protein